MYIFIQDEVVGCGSLTHRTPKHDPSIHMDMYDVWTHYLNASHTNDVPLFTPGVNDFIEVSSDYTFDSDMHLNPYREVFA
jgi:hypothetical protein